MFTNLHQPFPAHTLAGSIRMAAVIGLFVFLFLLIFQPFGMREAPDNLAKFLAIGGYGLVTFTCIALSASGLSRQFPGWFKPESWTVSKEIRITLFNFLLIGFFNMLYTALAFRAPFSLKQLLYFEGITLAVGLIPVSLIVLFRHNRLLHANLKLAQEMNAELRPPNRLVPPVEQPVAAPTMLTNEPLTFSADNGSEAITIPQQDFLFAVAADNYVELHFVENSQPKKSLIRSTLTRLEESVAHHPNLVRCHRAYLVNLQQVVNFSGNAQGLKLELHFSSERIPVSRKMVPAIKSLLHG